MTFQSKTQYATIATLLILAWTCTTLALGILIGHRYSWSYLDYATVERRQHEVFCEMAIKHGLLRSCSPKGLRDPLPL